MSAAELLFIACLAILVYTYAVYPILVYGYGLLFRKRRRIDEKERPTVSLIIPAHNEAGCIEAKIKNALELDYPADRLEILVASDASDDATVGLARAFAPRVRVLDFRERGGKMGTVNKAVREATGEVLVLTDANALFATYTLRELVKYFGDPKVGCVSGAKIIRNPNPALAATGMGESNYWKYESFLKYAESLSGSCVSADGSVYAVRKSAYPFPPDRRIIMDDLAVSLLVIKKGFDCVFEPAARAFEESATRMSDEFKRKTRIFAGAFSLFVARPGVLLSPVLPKLFSHKILRWLTFVFQAGLFGASWVLSGETLFRPVFGAQAVFYASALTGLVLNHFGLRIMVFHVPYYFTMTTFAQIWGIAHFLQHGQRAAWEKRR